MKKTQKALSIKKLQAELREEKQAELKRLVVITSPFRYTPVFLIFSSSRRREVTAERKKAAEEKRRLEEAKAQVRAFIVPYSSICYSYYPDGSTQGCKAASSSRQNEKN